MRPSHGSRPDIVQIASIFRARIVDVSNDGLTIEVTGDQVKVDGLIELLAPYGIREMARTGIAALERGPLDYLLFSRPRGPWGRGGGSESHRELPAGREAGAKIEKPAILVWKAGGGIGPWR